MFKGLAGLEVWRKRHSRLAKERGGNILGEYGEPSGGWSVRSQGFRGNNGDQSWKGKRAGNLSG